jgi:hypothetical protein
MPIPEQTSSQLTCPYRVAWVPQQGGLALVAGREGCRVGLGLHSAAHAGRRNHSSGTRFTPDLVQ